MTGVRGPSNGAGVWKAAAIALLTFVLGLLIAGGGYVLRAPTRNEVDFIRLRQDNVLQRLAAIETRQSGHEHEDERTVERVDALEDLVRDIIAGRVPISK